MSGPGLAEVIGQLVAEFHTRIEAAYAAGLVHGAIDATRRLEDERTGRVELDAETSDAVRRIEARLIGGTS